MAGTGYATIDFGAAPGSGSAVTTITGQAGILAGSFVEAWIFPKDTASHTLDEHRVDAPTVRAGNIVAGTGFTIYGDAADRPGSRLHGVWSVAWVWT